MEAGVARMLIQRAALAPSGHNTQPWKFSASGNVIWIYPDLTRRLPVVDPDDHALYISLGCALENLVITAAQHGYSAAVDYFPKDEREGCLRVRLTPNGSDSAEALFHAIPLRRSNRRAYDGRPIPDRNIEQLLSARDRDSITVKAFRPGAPDIEPIIGFVREGNRAQFSDRAFVNELVSWIRFSATEVRERQDGLTARALGFPSIPRWLGTFIMTRLVGPEGEAKRQEKAIRGSSLLLLFIARRHDRHHWIDLGRVFERTALTATALGIAHAHVNMPCEVESVRRKLASHLGLNQDEQPLLLIRLGYAKALPASPRRPIEQVMTVVRQ
jgi:hypothetical protein